MSAHYVAPEYKKKSFTCPHCSVFSAMKWASLDANNLGTDFVMATGHCCNQPSIWLVTTINKYTYNGKMIYPEALLAPMPNQDMPESCKQDYLEAREIAAKSPRGAAALLRLCIQKLCAELGEEGKNINADIAALVKKGLPVKIQQALDTVRVIGNNAVHPGELSIDDQPEVVNMLFPLVNMIVDQLITQPKKIDELFNELPQGAKEAIERRDNK